MCFSYYAPALYNFKSNITCLTANLAGAFAFCGSDNPSSSQQFHLCTLGYRDSTITYKSQKSENSEFRLIIYTL